MIYTEMEGRLVSLMGFYLKPSMEAGGGGASDRVYSSENDPGGTKRLCMQVTFPAQSHLVVVC